MSTRYVTASDLLERDRMARFRRGPEEHEHVHFEERDGPRGSQILLDERFSERGPRGRVQERERVYEEDRYPEPRPPPPRPVVALAPYRRPRPQFIRRQSSLDTYDRRPLPRYGDEFRTPPEVPIPLPIRRARSPERARYFEEYERERFRDGSPEDYRDIRIREERRGNHRSKSRMRSRSVTRRRSYSPSPSESSVEEVQKATLVGRRGRTKLPKRLARRSAIIELGYPFEEEDDFIIVQRALEKEHIDEIIAISKRMRDNKTVSYKYTGMSESGPPRFDDEAKSRDEEVTEVKKKEVKKEEIISDGHTVEKIEKKVEKEEITKEEKRPPVEDELVRRTTTTTVIDPPDHHHHHQDLAIVVPRAQTDREIRREIRALEAEREALRYEREGDWRLEKADRRRSGDWEVILRERDGREYRLDDYDHYHRHRHVHRHHHSRPWEVVRVEQDRKVYRPDPRAVALAMATLT